MSGIGGIEDLGRRFLCPFGANQFVSHVSDGEEIVCVVVRWVK